MGQRELAHFIRACRNHIPASGKWVAKDASLFIKWHTPLSVPAVLLNSQCIKPGGWVFGTVCIRRALSPPEIYNTRVHVHTYRRIQVTPSPQRARNICSLYNGGIKSQKVNRKKIPKVMRDWIM